MIWFCHFKLHWPILISLAHFNFIGPFQTSLAPFWTSGSLGIVQDHSVIHLLEKFVRLKKTVGEEEEEERKKVGIRILRLWGCGELKIHMVFQKVQVKISYRGDAFTPPQKCGFYKKKKSGKFRDPPLAGKFWLRNMYIPPKGNNRLPRL